MATTLYDINFNRIAQLLNQYANKRRLAGGVVDPNTVNSIVEGELSARYSDQRSRRAQDIQQDSINKNYELGVKGLEQNKALANQQLKAQKQGGLYQALGALPTGIMAGYKLGNEMGWWGEKPVNYQNEYYKRLIDGMNNTGGGGIGTNLYDSIYDSINTSYPSDFSGYNAFTDSGGNDISMALGDQVGDASNTDMSWFDWLKNWFI